MLEKFFLFLWLVVPAAGSAAGTTLTINYASVVSAVQPERFYGNNVAYWGLDSNYTTVRSKVDLTGAKFVRYPGGSNSNVYHWNGTGSYAGGIWQPNNTTWTNGFESTLSYRGSTSAGYGQASFLTDNVFTAASEWRSDTTTANSATPYIYIDLASVKPFNSVTVTWGTVYATSYNIQVSNGAMLDPPYGNAANNWVTVLAVAGAAGGTDSRAFAAQNARWVRIEMLTSSAGAPNRDYRVREFEIFNGATRQSVHSAVATTQSVAIASPSSYQSALNVSAAWHFDFEEYMAWLNAMTAPRPDPVITVNFGTGTPQEAAAWVHYANIVRGYNIKHWEIGNEMEGGWEYGGPVNAVYYANRFIQFAAAMKAEDPTIKIHGPTLGYLKTNNELYDASAPTFIDRFLKELQTQGQLSLLDVINFHVYAFFNNNNDATTLATPSDWSSGPNYKGYIDGLNAAYYPGSPRENMMSEYNSGYDTNFTVKLQNGLWLANWLGEYMKAYGSSGYAVLWDVVNGLNNNGKATWGDHAFLENGSASIAAPYRYQERAHYWAMHLMRNHFTQDGAGNSLVSATSTQSLLPVYACKRPDGHLTLLVINKDPATAYATTINIGGFTPNAAATLYTFSGAITAPYYVQNYNWIDSNSANSYANPDIAPSSSAFAGAGASFAHTFPAYSLSVFDLTNANQTFTSTPTFSPSPTVTPTPTPVMNVIWDDFELNQPVYSWSATADIPNGATITAYAISSAPAAVHTGVYGYSSSVNTGPAASWGATFTQPSPYGTGPGLGYRDMTGMVWLQAWVKTSLPNLKIRLAVMEAGNTTTAINGADGEQFLSNGGLWTTVTTAGVWTLLSFPLSGFTDDPYYPYSPATLGNNTLNLGAIANVSVQVNGNQGSGISLYFDDIVFLTALGAPSMTPTPTPSITRTATPMPSATPSPTPTVTSSGTGTPTPSRSPSASYSATRTATSTATPSASVTPSSSASSSATASASRTATGSNTASPSASATGSATRSATASSSPSQTPTRSPSVTETFTDTPVFTLTVSPTDSPTSTMSPSPTSSVTVTKTSSPTQSDTLSPSPAASMTPSPSASATPSPSGTLTQSATSSTTPSPTHSASGTLTLSATPSALGTLTPTPTLTYSLTPTSGGAPGPAIVASAGDPPDVIDLAAVPNPQFGPGLNLAFNLSAPADQVELRIYSRAMALVSLQHLNVAPCKGWQRGAFDSGALANGIYYIKLWAKAQGASGKASKPAKLLWLP